MRHKGLVFLVLLSAALAAVSQPAVADVSLPSIIGENMVLQQNKPIPIWGWADPEERITVEFLGQEKSVAADGRGDWSLRLEPVKAGGPYELTIRGKNTLVFSNVLVGEVWICSGQSNMEWPVSRADNSKQEIASANYPKIHLFTVPHTVAEKPQRNVTGSWVECSPATVSGFSAVGYFFGRSLHQRLGVPIGLINSSWGGTLAEAWTSRSTLEADPDYEEILERGRRQMEEFEAALEWFEKDYKSWKEELRRARLEGSPVSDPPGMPRIEYRNPHRPSVLYNGMIAPLISYAIRGVIWYQGESNATRAYQYRKLFPDMIVDWRENWGQGDFPFLFVQLANFIQRYAPETAWAELREAQNMALSLANTAAVVTIDIGNPTDIHPTNKQEVGRRLALAARAIAYGEEVVYSGPMYKSMKIERNRIRISFDHVEGGLISGDGGELKGFSIAGSTRKFVEAEAKIDGDTVIVWNEKIRDPIAVRYGWEDNPAQCNLCNRAGLPASPFRTDDWPGVTAGAR